MPPLVPHCLAPAVHAFVQHEAAPALTVHAPFAHVSDESRTSSLPDPDYRL